MYKLISFLFISTCMSIPAYGTNFFSNRLDIFACSSEEAARNCSRCVREKGVTVQLDVNVEKSVVILNIYEGNKNVNGGPLDECKVVDKKNWQCGNDGKYDDLNNYSQSIQGMNNGGFYSIMRYRLQGNPRFNIKPSNTEIFNCAK